MQISNINLLTALTELKKLSSNKNAQYFDALCNFFVDQFALQAVIIFKMLPNSNTLLLGKSYSARRDLKNNTTYSCENCMLHQPQAQHLSIHTDSSCKLKATDFLLYEACILLKTDNNDKYLLKVAQKTPFTQLERESLEIIANFITLYLREDVSSSPSGSFNKLLIDISNDLRTPSNSILGFASLLADKTLSSSQVEYVASIKDNAQKLLNLINEVVDVAKLDIGQIHENPLGTSVDQLINEVIESFKERLPNKMVTFDVLKSDNEAHFIKVDAQKMKYIIQNTIMFISSFFDYGKILIDIQYKKDLINIRIIERKTALSPQLINYFNQSSSNSPVAYKVEGLSPLTISLIKKYASLIGSAIDITSTKEDGTQVTLIFKTEFLSALESQIIGLPKTTAGNNKILVIEDDYATSKLLSNYLNKWNYAPTIVNSGKKALNMLEEETFLAIITDVILPDINGLELLQKIRENKKTRSTPIIVCSVEAEKQKAFLMGAVEYFQKPIKYKDLVEVLTSYRLKKNSNVLCVDDDIPTLSLIKEAIESAGYIPVATHRSTEVMRMIETIELDLAIVDLDMPEINGFQLIKLIKSNPKFANLPIIIYTGKENFDDDLKNLDGLFTELLSKRSTNMEDLAKVINNMINRYEEPTSPEIAAKETDAPKILLVEDYKHSQIIVTRLLKKNNFNTVVVVENGAEAVEQVKKQKFDLILMDMQMPIMNGFEATERIRQMPEYKATPIIALTAFAMKGDKEKCLDAGATDYIAKPIDSQEFIEKVRFYTS